jgi:hypothetical protein
VFTTQLAACPKKSLGETSAIPSKAVAEHYTTPSTLVLPILEKTIKEEPLHRMIVADQKKSLGKKNKEE